MIDGPLTLADYAEAYRTGALTPSGMAAAVLARLAGHDDPAMFIAVRSAENLQQEAAALERRGPEGLALYGVPVAIKDNIDVAGLPTTAACPGFAYTPAVDAVAVARLRQAGAIVIGKTNLDQFATGLVGVRSPYGVPRNTLRPELVPGGSSSGSAVAVAAGIVPIALGSDTAGSGRVPAGLNNIVGLKPTLGAVPIAGAVPACRSLDCLSVFALTVADVWTAYGVIAGYEPSDPFSRNISIGTPGPIPPALRIGVPDGASRRFGGDPLAEAAFDVSVGALADGGAAIVPVDLAPFYATAALLYDGPWVAERYAVVRKLMDGDPDAMLPVTRAIIGRATAFSAADAFAAQYRLAELRRATEPVWTGIDALLVPTFPRPQTLAALAADPIGPNAELGTYTNFVNLLDLCALAVPGAFRPDGLPAGTTLIAPAGHDSRIAAIGAWLHHGAGTPLGATGRPAPAFREPEPGLAREEVALVVVGAHLSGLALNGELSGLGARFVRAVRTAPDYRLYALPGGPPRRPGLLRIGEGGGAAIEAEVWALAPAGFGRFVATVPAPLTIGTVRLADGTSAKGFLVEAEAIRAALDISALGGWRAYLAREASRAGALAPA